ncbi:MAG: toll/interleukin receptor protein [Mucilaginibacter sp.]|nr:toll/interleukin receptor protein [Mucilaginibacter sp.]
MARIFISYSNQDRDIRSDLAQKLSSFGHFVIDDQPILDPASNFDEGLSKAMREADGSLFLLTQNSVHSRYVMKEWRSADQMRVSEGKFLIRIVAEKTELPSFVQQIQYLKLEDPRLLDKIQEVILRAVPGKKPVTSTPPAERPGVPPVEPTKKPASEPKKRVKVQARQEAPQCY